MNEKTNIRIPGGPMIPVIVCGAAATAAVAGILALTPWPWLAPTVAIMVVLPLLMIRNPEPFFLFIVILIPMNAWRGLSEQIPALTVSKLLGMPLLAAVAVRIVLEHRKGTSFAVGQWIIPTVMLIIWIIATLQSPWKAQSADNVRQLIQALAFTALAVWFTARPGAVRRITLALAGSATAAAVIAVAGFALHIPGLMVTPGGTGNPAMRAIGTGNDPNIFAAGVLFSLPSTVAWAIRTQGPARIAWGTAVAAQCAAVVLTYSRSIMLMLFGALLMLGFEHRRRIRAHHLLPLTAATVVILAALMIQTGGAPLQRLATLKDSSSDPSLMRRSSYISVALSAVTQRPLIGWGPGTFDQLYSRSRWAAAFAWNAGDFFRKAHNTFLEIAVGSGVVGLAVFLLLCGRSLHRLLGPAAVGPEDLLLRAVGLGLIMLLLAFLTLSDPFHKYIWLAVGIGMAIPLTRQSNTENI